MEQKQEKFSTIGYIAAALGMCIGTGNVWRFPRVCAANGGGAFIIAWTIAMLVFAVPLLSTEMAFGKRRDLDVSVHSVMQVERNIHGWDSLLQQYVSS